MPGFHFKHASKLQFFTRWKNTSANHTDKLLMSGTNSCDKSELSEQSILRRI